MNVSLRVLNNYVKVDDIEPIDLANKITSVGLEVEGLHSLAKGTKLVVGYVHECRPHCDSDHLNVCLVEVAPGIKQQIVCGAPNVAAKQKVIVALPGCDLGEGFVIKESKIRGEESNGMICSLGELGIDSRFLNDEQRAGIEILPTDAPIGQEALVYLGLEDTILDIGLTPNRSDCMALTALAYEVGAVLNRPVLIPTVSVGSTLESDVQVEIATDKCSFFGAKVVKGVVTKESPLWLKNTLIASGIKPINNIVDISNYVMLETGQPIHMYDYDKLVEKKFIVKTGYSQEKTLLDGLDYKIEENDVVVSVDDKIGCIAGVMGSDDTKIEDTTTNIVIEAATFDGASLRNTARRLNLLTDASQHYIKGAIDTAKSFYVLDRCASLLQELAQASEIYQTVASDYTPETKVIALQTSRVNGLLGTDITSEEVKDIFTSLCFEYTYSDDSFEVVVPTYRNDITMEADLIEEVARMYGYDNIPSSLPTMSMTQGNYTEIQSKENLIKNTLVDLGLHETLTYTLTSPTTVDDFNLFHAKENITLMSPLGEERSVCRKSLIPSLLQVINYNLSHANKDVGIFEISNSYSDNEIKSLAIACTGTYQSLPWQQMNQAFDFYVVKGLVDTLFKKLTIEESRYQLKRVEVDNPYFHPGRSGYIMMGKEIVGVVGQVHPSMQKNYGVKATYVAEVNLTTLLNLKTRALKFESIPMYPSVSRDLALVMDEDIASYDITRCIQKAGKRLVKDTTIFDVYVGEHIETGKKSVAVSMVFQDPTKTLDEATINATVEQILAALQKEYNAVLRA
ncbi:phenylalanine--tRNA ligase subunit beta [Tannockella kyphosi]|uniref:phenylalanine--tRNA ligase subunit beta n=1 Tax=Tannockella kyphosi TaxID=2899121 RepID=UPI002011D6FB|nr:phenylalanine--tRNA ligase subunit beta [Tannockella kyphosi]